MIVKTGCGTDGALHSTQERPQIVPHLYDGCAEHGDVSIVKLVLNLLRGQIVICDLDLLGWNVNVL